MKKVINSPAAPAAIGPYSQAIQLGNMVFTSGQLPLDPVTMVFPEGGIKEQTVQALKNVQAVVEQSGGTLASVVKTTCFLSDMAHFAQFNEVYLDFFGTDAAPARSCVEVSELPKSALVEIEAIAFVNAE